METKDINGMNILSEYRDLLEGLGCMREEYDIELKSNAFPIASPAENLFNRKIRGILPTNQKYFYGKINYNLREKLVEKQFKDRYFYNSNKRDLRPLELGEGVLFRMGRLWNKGIIKGIELYTLEQQTSL